MPPRYEPDDAIREQARQWLARLRSGQATEADAEEFARWRAQSPLHGQAAKDLGRAWRGLHTAAATVAQGQAAANRSSTSTRSRPRVHTPRPGRRAFLGGALAAGVAWLTVRPPLDLWPSIGEFAADYRTGTGEQRQLALADGLQVEMNTQTRINVRTDVQAGAVELLAGEAEILVNGRDVCTVLAGSARLQTRAARFNVRYIGPDVQVSCLEGSVELDHPLRRTTIAASQQLTYDAQTVRLSVPADSGTVLAWRRGLLLFDDTPLVQVVEELNRYRPGKIFVQNEELGRRRVQAQFSIHKIDAALALIRDLYGAQVRRLPGEIVLLS